MLWTALVVGVGMGSEWWGLDAGTQKQIKRDLEKGKGVEEANGEAVREEMEAWTFGMAVKTGVWGLGWAMGMMGLWGDGA